MHYIIPNNQNLDLKVLFPQGIPTYGYTPDDFIETYDESGCELIDIQPAFRVNIAGLTTEQELKLFQLYASAADDPLWIESCFRLLANGWVAIPQEQVESVVWRESEKVVDFECGHSTAPTNQ